MNNLFDPSTIFTARNAPRESAPIAPQSAEQIASRLAAKVAQEERALAQLRARTEEVRQTNPSQVAYYAERIARGEKRIADLKGQQ